MPVIAKCPTSGCRGNYRVPDDRAGAPLRCPLCKKTFSPSAELPATPTIDPPHSTVPSSSGSSPSASFGSAVALERVGRFIVLGKLGSGAFGTVFKARDPQLERDVALKMPNPGMLDTPKRVERFLREAKASARLRHPNIVPLFDAGMDGDRYYIASAFVSGKPLAEAIDERGIEFRRAAEIVRLLAEAVGYAHDQGIVHRDIKPANVMLDSRDQPHLMDFGLAARADEAEKLTNDGAILGTPAYMSPEQAAGHTGEASPLSDQYALGVVLYELLTGQAPFSGPPAAVIYNVIHKDPATPRSIRPYTPRDLETICMKAMAKKPEGRYGNCRALAEDLGRWLGGEPIEARYVGALERGIKWARRKPTIAGMIALVALTLVAGTAVSLFFAAQSGARAKEAAINASDAIASAQKEKDARISEGKARQEADERSLTARRHAYANAVNLAQQAWENGLVSRAKTLLALQAPGPNEEDLRGFEWHFLWRLCHTEKWSVRGHAGRVRAVSCSRDGKYVATAGGDVVLVWDSKTGQPIALPPIRGSVAAFSPDSQMFAVSTGEDVRLFNPVTGREIALLGKHPGAAHALAFSEDGSLLVSGSYVQVKVWDVAKRQPRATWNQRCIGLAISRDCRRIVICDGGGDGRVLDVGTGETVGKTFHSGGQLRAVAFTADGKSVVYASQDRTIYFHDTETGEKQSTLSCPTGRPEQITFSRDGKMLAVGTEFGSLIFDLATMQKRGFHSDSQVEASDFSPDGSELVAAESNGTIHMHKVIADAGGERCGGAFSTAVGAIDKTANIATGQFNNVVVAWDADNRKVQTELTAAKSARDRGTIWAFHTNGRLAGASEQGVTVWDSPQSKERKFPLPLPGIVKAAAISFDGNGLATAVNNGKEDSIIVWDLTTGRERMSRPVGASALAFSPSSSLLAFFSQTHPKGESIWLWDFAAKKDPVRLALTPKNGLQTNLLTYEPVSLAFHPSGTLVASTNRDGNCYLWNVPSGQLRTTLRGHVGPVYAVAFSPDGKTVATGGLDTTVKLWQVATGQELASLRGHGEEVFCLSFSADGQSLVSGSGDWQSGWKGSTLLWRAADRSASEVELRRELDAIRVLGKSYPNAGSR